MGERRKVVNPRTISYSGLFDGKEIYKIIKSGAGDIGYDNWVEQDHNEKDGKDGRQVELAYLPKMKITDYIELQLSVDLKYSKMKKTKVKYKGKDITVDEGDLEITFEGYIHSDYWSRWESPNWFFLRTIMDKFIFKTYYNKYTNQLKSHIDRIYDDVREYLNTTKK